MASTAENPLGSSAQTISTLFAIAGLRLRTAGRLAFWLPSQPELNTEDVISELNTLQSCAGEAAQTLKFIRADSKNYMVVFVGGFAFTRRIVLVLMVVGRLT